MSSPEPPLAAPIEPDSKKFEPPPVLPSGIEAGIVGGAVVAAIFLIRDAFGGEPLHTPSVLGTLLVEGPEAARLVVSAPGAAVIYHTLHFVLWILAGSIGVWMMHRVEESAKSWYLPWIGVGALSLVCVGLDGWAASSGLERTHLWLGSIAGLAAMTWFFQWRYPRAMALVRGFGKS